MYWFQSLPIVLQSVDLALVTQLLHDNYALPINTALSVSP